jgi:tRNA(fMet)-specific endonuclease VapC
MGVPALGSIAASAPDAGFTTLWSEDFQDGQLMEGRLRIRNRAMENLIRLVESIPILGLPESEGRHFGCMRAALAAAGTPIGGNQLWMAAHAAAGNLTLVSNSSREFERVPGLRVENWVGQASVRS